MLSLSHSPSLPSLPLSLRPLPPSLLPSLFSLVCFLSPSLPPSFPLSLVSLLPLLCSLSLSLSLALSLCVSVSLPRSLSWAPEGDCSHQAVAIYLGTNLVAWQSQRQSLVALSSAEAELIASIWGNRLALSLYGQLKEMILSKPPYITYCDNSAVVQLTQQLSASKTRTRHLLMRASWLHHLVQHENVSMQFVPTTHQKADILTKGLTAYAHGLAREGLPLQICDGL